MPLLAQAVAPATHPIASLPYPSVAGATFSKTPGARARGGAVLTLLVSFLTLFAAPARAGDLVPEWRVAEAYRHGEEAMQLEAAWYGPAPRWFRAVRLEYAVGVIRDSERRHAFAFIGPVWRMTRPARRWFAEISTGPTVLTGSTVQNRELGGRLHFRSAIAIGNTFGARRNLRLALRVSHISNGGTRNDNPGLDFVGLSFSNGYPATANSSRRNSFSFTTRGRNHDQNQP